LRWTRVETTVVDSAKKDNLEKLQNDAIRDLDTYQRQLDGRHVICLYLFSPTFSATDRAKAHEIAEQAKKKKEALINTTLVQQQNNLKTQTELLDKLYYQLKEAEQKLTE
jgi:hypothetical protein